MSPILVKAESDPVLLNNTEKLDILIYGLYPIIGAAILERWDFSPAMVKVPRDHLKLEHENDGNVDYTDIVQVALIQTVAGTDHPLGQVNMAELPAFQRLGMADVFEEIDMSGGVEEVKEAIS